MKIETKYNVGDSVWIERFNFDKNNYIPDDRKIVEIAIYVKEKSLNIIYSLDTPYLQSFFRRSVICDKKSAKKCAIRKIKWGGDNYEYQTKIRYRR